MPTTQDNKTIKPQHSCRVITMIQDVSHVPRADRSAMHHRTLSRLWRHLDAPCIYHSVQKGISSCSQQSNWSQRCSTCMRSGAHFTQSRDPILQACRRPRPRVASPRSFLQSVDERPHQAESERGLSSQRLRPRTMASCPHGCVGGPTRLAPESRAGSQRWETSLQDAMSGQQCPHSRIIVRNIVAPLPQRNCWAEEISDFLVLPACRVGAERCLVQCRCAVGIMSLYLC
jgi:hypothetical protein